MYGFRVVNYSFGGHFFHSLHFKILGVCWVSSKQNFNVFSLSQTNALVATTIGDANIFPLLHHPFLPISHDSNSTNDEHFVSIQRKQ